jgi:thiol-disulfide isomerase/thioredoxin
MEKILPFGAMRFRRLTRIAALCCLISLAGCGNRRPALVERPAFEVRNSSTLEIEKIETSDTATMLYCKVYFTPKQWVSIDREIFIRESGTDEKLIATGSVGIALGEKFYIPDIGETYFKLIFPPLRGNVTRIDFIESDCRDCFKMWGIRLLHSDAVEFEPPPAKLTDTSLPETVYSNRPARLSGKIIGYRKEVMSEITVLDHDMLTAEDREIAIPLNEDGTFSSEIHVGLPHIVQTSLGSVFLTPGRETGIVYDLVKRSRIQSRLRTDGSPVENHYVYLEGSPMTYDEIEAVNDAGRVNYNEMFSDVVDLKPDSYKEYMLEISREKIRAVNRTTANANVQLLSEKNAKLAAYSLLMDYEGFVSAARSHVGQVKGKINRQRLEKPAKSYYSFVRELTDNRMVYTSNYAGIAGSIYSLDVFSSPADRGRPVAKRFAAFKARVAPLAGTDKGLLFDLLQAKMYGEQLGEMKFYTDAEKKEINTVFAEQPQYAEALLAANDRIIQLVDSGKGLINEVPDVADSRVFDAIMAKYRGKTVLVDFWATWCGPCIQAIETIKQLKKELKGKDVVFVYLTGPSSPIGTWYRKIPDIDGEHYRVSDSQWKAFGRQFDIRGIPTYLVYDSDGTQLQKFVGYPGNEALKELLQEGY